MHAQKTIYWPNGKPIFNEEFNIIIVNNDEKYINNSTTNDFANNHISKIIKNITKMFSSTMFSKKSRVVSETELTRALLIENMRNNAVVVVVRSMK